MPLTSAGTAALLWNDHEAVRAAFYLSAVTTKRSEEAFWSRVAALGAIAAPGATYRNSHTPVSLICAQGHSCAPRPDNLLRGQGPCQTCAGRDRTAAAE